MALFLESTCAVALKAERSRILENVVWNRL